MQADRLRAASTLSSCFLELQRGCHLSNPVALPSYLLLLYVFSCSEHLTKDNLFGCLMLRHWPVEDYMRWPSDLWWLVVGCSKYRCMWGESVTVYIQCACVFVSVSVCVCVCSCSLTQTSVVFSLVSSELIHLWKKFLFVLFSQDNIHCPLKDE